MWTAVYIFLGTLLPVLVLALRDIPVINGCTLASGTGEKIYMKILLPVIFLAALVVSSCRQQRPFLLPPCCFR